VTTSRKREEGRTLLDKMVTGSRDAEVLKEVGGQTHKDGGGAEKGKKLGSTLLGENAVGGVLRN